MDSDLNSEMVLRATAGSFSTLEVDRGLPAGPSALENERVRPPHAAGMPWARGNRRGQAPEVVELDRSPGLAMRWSNGAAPAVESFASWTTPQKPMPWYCPGQSAGKGCGQVGQAHAKGD
jgi:hypothetical protein